MEYLLVLTFILAPAYAVRFNFFNLPLNLLMVWVFLFWIIFSAWLIVKKQLFLFLTAVKNKNKTILIFSGLFLLSGLLSLFIGGIDRAKLGQFIVLFLQPISIFFIAGYIFRQDPKSKNLLCAMCYVLLAVAGLYAILQYFTLFGLPPTWWGNSVEPKRSISFFVHPNFYALWCAPLLAFLIPGVVQRIKNHAISSEPSGESRNLSDNRSLHSSSDALVVGRDGGRKYILFLILWLLGAIGLLLSLSRAGWLGLAVAVLAYLIFAADAKIRKIIFGAVIVIAIVIISFPNLRWRFTLSFYGEKSAVSRLSLWQTGIKGVKESPILGLGLTGFSRQWATLNTDPGLTDTHNFPHNIFLDLWVETGLIGLISLIGLIGLYIYRGLRPSVIPAEAEPRAGILNLDSRFRGNDIIKLSVALFLIALLVQGQIDNPYLKNDLAMVFWVILALG